MSMCYNVRSLSDFPPDAHEDILLFLSLAYLRLYAVGQSLLRCSSSKDVVANSTRQSVSRITEGAPSCVGANPR
jgi:hypothetical protein